MKLVFGDHTCLYNLDKSKDNWVILNFNSYLEGYDRVNLIVPTHNDIINPMENKNFDIQYVNYILNNDYAFMEFMKIIMPLYMGANVFVLISKNDIFEYISESLQKFIQTRYGLIPSVINEPGDLEYVEDTSFNIFGVANLDIDKERYTLLYVNQHPELVAHDLGNKI